MIGGGAGHIADMIARLRNNRSMLKNKRFFKNHKTAEDIDFSKHKEQKLYYGKASKQQLQQIRDELNDDQQKVVGKKIMTLFLSFIITTIIILLIVVYLEDILEFMRNF
jgi:chromate transport protein ChrA